MMTKKLIYGTVIVTLAISVTDCKPPFLLKFASARKIAITERHNKLQISGRTIHSGACVDEVKQERDDGNVVLRVELMPSNSRCSGEFFVMVDKGENLRSVKLGIPGSQDPQELGTIWEAPAPHN